MLLNIFFKTFVKTSRYRNSDYLDFIQNLKSAYNFSMGYYDDEKKEFQSKYADTYYALIESITNLHDKLPVQTTLFNKSKK